MSRVEMASIHEHEREGEELYDDPEQEKKDKSNAVVAVRSVDELDSDPESTAIGVDSPELGYAGLNFPPWQRKPSDAETPTSEDENAHLHSPIQEDAQMIMNTPILDQEGPYDGRGFHEDEGAGLGSHRNSRI